MYRTMPVHWQMWKWKVYGRRNWSARCWRDDPYLTDDEFVDDDGYSHKEDMNIDDLENDYFLDE